MAQEEKKKETSKGQTGGNDPWELILVLILALFIGGIVVERIITFLNSEQPFLESLRSYLLSPFLITASVLISGLFIIGTVYSVRNLTLLNREYKLKFHSSSGQISAYTTNPEEMVNKRWQKVLDLIESPNMTDWKLAILEADIMLNDMVNKIGYPGDNLGDKLKNIERSDFINLDKAWEAHKIRNAIAHEGTNFLITQREARRVAGLFEEVFKEFRYI